VQLKFQMQPIESHHIRRLKA